MRRSVSAEIVRAVALAVLGVLGALCGSAGFAQPTPAPTAPGTVYPNAKAPQAAIEQRLGAALPLADAFVEADGRPVRLGDFFAATAGRAAVPVVLVLGYYHCPQLCETVMQGALEALARSGARRSEYRVVAVSIDPAETPADAAMRTAVDRRFADFAAQSAGRDADAATPLDLHELVGRSEPIARLAERAGFVFSRTADGGSRADEAATGPASPAADKADFAHASGFLVATPQGRISRYFLGVRHDPQALRSALDAASGESIGSLVDRLVLLCAHLDPTLGRLRPAGARRHAPARHRSGAGLGRMDLAPPAPLRTRGHAVNGSTDSSLEPSFRLIEQSASTIAARSDLLFLSMLVACGVLALVLGGLVVFFAVRYRSGSNADRSTPPSGARGLEIAWTAIPTVIFVGLFVWAARDFVAIHRPPDDALPIYVVGKQWMWKLQHRNGPARDQRAARAAGPAGCAW